MSDVYNHYFEIDSNYFPCLDDSAIAAGAKWENTYPHETFIALLTAMEKALARQNDGKSLWIEGSYGTGKSQCAYALRQLLTVSPSEFDAYWNTFEALKRKPDLRTKLIGHREKGILVAHRYASGYIENAHDLFYAVQESIMAALRASNVSYKGEDSFKDSVVAWLEDDIHKMTFDRYLNDPKRPWQGEFSQSSADEVIRTLKKNDKASDKVNDLISKIIKLGKEEGITTFSLNADRLIAWIKDIIEKNHIQIVLVWDEFSDYFKNNLNSLTEFQKIAALVQSSPFYFIIVTHNIKQFLTEHDNNALKKLLDRFVIHTIELPEHIALKLIGHAFCVKDSAKSTWDEITGDLDQRTPKSRAKVMKASDIDNPNDIRKVFPIHPMTTIFLKFIAEHFQSNQRSMFDFIKSQNSHEVKAFQWFIENHSPFENNPFLTTDMLWDFFYEHGKNKLSTEILSILRTYDQHASNLRSDEQRVFKAILIMQAVSQQIAGNREGAQRITIANPTQENLGLVFEGTDLQNTFNGIANKLKNDGILIATGGGKTPLLYSVAVLAGDQAQIEKYKKEFKDKLKTSQLITNADLANVLNISAALKLRFAPEEGGRLPSASVDDFSKQIYNLRDKQRENWRCKAILLFAKDESEACRFQTKIRETVQNPDYKDIVFIDATATPIAPYDLEEYIEAMALCNYQQTARSTASNDFKNKAEHILSDWKQNILRGRFVIYYTSPNSENHCSENKTGIQEVKTTLECIVKQYYPYALEFNGFSETQIGYKSPQTTTAAKGAITHNPSGACANIKDKAPIKEVWDVHEYWTQPGLDRNVISIIKKDIDALIQKRFKKDGNISIRDIYESLKDNYAFPPCPLSSFIMGFILKEYSASPYQYADSRGSSEPMSPDKLAEMIGNIINKPQCNDTYIVKMCPEDMAYCQLTQKAWKIKESSATSADMASRQVETKMREFKLPIWCLKTLDTQNLYPIVEQYIQLVQSEGSEKRKLERAIGKEAMNDSLLPNKLESFITKENIQTAMLAFLETFDDGRILSLARQIDAQDTIIQDIKRLFDVKYACIWNIETGCEQIQSLAIEYKIVIETNELLNTCVHSLNDAITKWREKLKFLGISYESLGEYCPDLKEVIDILYKVYKNTIPGEQYKKLLDLFETKHTKLKSLLDDDLAYFKEIYSNYLNGLSDEDIRSVKSRIATAMFDTTARVSSEKVKETADEMRKNMVRTQLSKQWQERTRSDSPKAWSNAHHLPILYMVSADEYGEAKAAFDILDHLQYRSEGEIKKTFEFIQNATFFETLNDQTKQDEAFKKHILGTYAPLFRDLDIVRKTLTDLAAPCDWEANQEIRNRVQALATDKYQSGGCEVLLHKIDEMSAEEAKNYFRKLISNNVTIGMEILTHGA